MNPPYDLVHMKFTLIFLLFLSFGLKAQDESLDVSFIHTQRTDGSPFALPISINSQGEISYFGSNGTDKIAINPVVQVAYSKATINYSQPIALNRFNFYPIQKDLGWIEVKRRRMEGGLGLQTLIKNTTTAGFMPYKGALQTIVRHKNSQFAKSLPFVMPQELSEIRDWNVGDFGTFQTYGGVTFYIGLSAGIAELANLSTGFQNQFIIEMKKTSEDKLQLTILEEEMERSQSVLGPVFVNGVFGKFDGKRFGAEFTLNLNDTFHEELFRSALDGDLKKLQENLPFEDQKQFWEGKDSTFYVGIPWVVGTSKMKAHYEISEDDESEVELEIHGSKNQGLLRPLRNIYDFAYHTEKNIVLVWTSEMSKATPKAVEKSFLSKGKILGVKGFNRDYPRDTRFGATVSQIGLELSRNEIAKVKNADMDKFEEVLATRCLQKELPCRKIKKRNKILNEFKTLISLEWNSSRAKLANLLSKEPVLVHSIVKTIKAKKEVYFKFLSEKFQSLEGSAAIEL